MGKLHIYKPGQPVEVIERDQCPSLAEMQAMVGGYIEIVDVMFNGKRCQMIVDEDGFGKQLRVNESATTIYHATALRRGASPLPIVGTAVVFEGVRIT